MKPDSKSQQQGVYLDHKGYEHRWMKQEFHTNTNGRFWIHIHQGGLGTKNENQLTAMTSSGAPFTIWKSFKMKPDGTSPC